MPKFDNIKCLPAPIRILLFLLVLATIWLPGAAVIYWLISTTGDPNDPVVANRLTIWTMGLLTIEFICLLPWWGKNIWNTANIFARYGLVFTRTNGVVLLKGFSIGAIFAFALFIVQGWLGWLTWRSPSLPLWQLISEATLSSFGIAVAEELFFRGWVLDELERDYQPRAALTIDVLLFAISHFLKSIELMIRGLPQFPGLILFGVVMVVAKRSHGNLLGVAIGLHAGMVWAYYLIKVGNSIEYTNKVSDWFTGIYGMPTAGILGLVFLVVLIIFVDRTSPRSLSRRVDRR
jgi:uncharacterized protein